MHGLQRRSQWPNGLNRESAADRLLEIRVRIPPGSSMSVTCECYVLLGKGLCNGPIPRPEESYRLLCITVPLSRGWQLRQSRKKSIIAVFHQCSTLSVYSSTIDAIVFDSRRVAKQSIIIKSDCSTPLSKRGVCHWLGSTGLDNEKRLLQYWLTPRVTATKIPTYRSQIQIKCSLLAESVLQYKQCPQGSLCSLQHPIKPLLLSWKWLSPSDWPVTPNENKIRHRVRLEVWCEAAAEGKYITVYRRCINHISVVYGLWDICIYK